MDRVPTVLAGRLRIAVVLAARSRDARPPSHEVTLSGAETENRLVSNYSPTKYVNPE